MGCSSSAHSTTAGTPQVETDSTDMRTEIVGDRISIKKPRTITDLEATANNELPILCDNDKVVQVEVDRHPESSTKKDNTAEEDLTDDRENMIQEKNYGVDEDGDNISQDIEDRLSRLEEVVEKVVELYINENNQILSTESNLEDSDQENINNDAHFTNEQQSDFIDTSQGKAGNTNDEASEESAAAVGAASPVSRRSAGSRATRWEALADIAAELPPSLAVDPLTGQIYALSK